jgi:hypothetical protein
LAWLINPISINNKSLLIIEVKSCLSSGKVLGVKHESYNSCTCPSFPVITVHTDHSFLILYLNDQKYISRKGAYLSILGK